MEYRYFLESGKEIFPDGIYCIYFNDFFGIGREFNAFDGDDEEEYYRVKVIKVDNTTITCRLKE